MIDKQLLNKCKNIIARSDMTNEQFNYCNRVLNDLLKIDVNNDSVYVLLGKLFLNRKYIEQSKKYFEKAKEINDNNITVYYGLLRVNILTEDYKNAKNNLNKYIELQKNNNLNLELYKILIDKLLGEDNSYNIDDRFFYEKLNGGNLLLYLNGIKQIIEGKYDDAKNLFNELDSNVKNQKILIDFQYIIELINQLAIKKEIINVSEFDEIFDSIKDNIWNNEYKELKEKISYLLSHKMSVSQTELLLHIIPDLLNIDEYEMSIKITQKTKQNDIQNKFSKINCFYERLIKELNEMYNLEGTDRSDFQYFLRTGIDYFNSKEFYKALDSFSAGLYKTNINIFNYYCGKTNYFIGKYKQARRELMIYNDGGAYKIYQCKHYLSKINFDFGKKVKAYQLSSDAEFFANAMNKYYKSKLNVKNGDKYLNKLFKLINITEEDFLDEKRLTKKATE